MSLLSHFRNLYQTLIDQYNISTLNIFICILHVYVRTHFFQNLLPNSFVNPSSEYDMLDFNHKRHQLIQKCKMFYSLIVFIKSCIF